MNNYVIAKYIRLSLEDLKYDSLSISNQRNLLDKHIETLDIENAEVLEFEDNGWSGTNFERPAVQELLELVKCSKVNCIIVKDFSRFGRNSIEMGYFIEKVFPIFGVRFISINDNFDSSTFIGETGGLEVAFKYLINEIYSQDLSVKTKSAKYAKMRRGEYQAKVCFYGYKVTADKKLIPDENTAPVVKMIFELAHQGKSSFQISQVLYEKGIPTPGEYKTNIGHKGHDVSRTNGVWGRSTLCRLLNDERYTGMYIIGKRELVEIGGRTSRYKDESEWIKIPNHHPVIIEPNFYKEVQAKLRRWNGKKEKVHEYPLKSKIVCGCCNHTMYRANSVFACKHSRIDKTLKCHGLKISESVLETTIFEIIKKQAKIIIGVDNFSNPDELTSKLGEQSKYEKQIRYCMDEKRRLYEQHILGEINDAMYREQKAVFDAKLTEIKGQHSVLIVKTEKLQSDSLEATKLKSVAEKIVAEKSLTRELVEALIDKVEVFPGEQIEVVWKFSDFAGGEVGVV